MSRFGNFNYYSISEGVTSENEPNASNSPEDEVSILGVYSPKRGELVSLLCPLSGKRIRDPVRGRNCKHLRAFDKENFLSSKTFSTFFGAKDKQNCPICLCEIEDNLALVPADDIKRCLDLTNEDEVTAAFLKNPTAEGSKDAKSSPNSEMSWDSEGSSSAPKRSDTKLVSPHTAKYGADVDEGYVNDFL